MTTNIVRRTERSGTSQQAASAVLMENELGVLTDVKKLVVGDGSKAGGYTLTPDNVVAVDLTDQSDAAAPQSLAWWVSRAGANRTTLRLPAGVYNVLGDLTLPANVRLEIDNGVVFNVAAGKTLTMNCEIGADTCPQYSGSGSVVENYIRRLHINENLVRHSQSCWSTGYRDSLGGLRDAPDDNSNGYYHRYYLRSEMIPVTAGGCYTLKAWSDACACILSFFDAEGAFLSRNSSLTREALQAGVSFTVPDGAAFVELLSWLPMSPSGYLYTRLSDVGCKHLYKLEEGPVATSFFPAPADSQASCAAKRFTRPRNDPEAARQLVSCAESYKGKGWVYGNSQTANDPMTLSGPAAQNLRSDGVKSIDCLTLITQAVAGIPYFQSKYLKNTFPWRGAKYYDWGVCAPEKFLEGFARWVCDNGWEIEPGENYCNLQAGDLVFWGMNHRKAGYDKTKTAFRGIDHVAMFTGRWLTDTVPANNRADDGLLHPQTIEVSDTGAVVVNNFLDRVSTLSGGGSPPAGCSVEFIQMFARIPLTSPYTEYDSAAENNTNNVVYSSHYRPSAFIYGNGERINIDIYGRNCAVWTLGGISDSGELIASAYHVYSNLIAVDGVTKNLTRLSALGFTVYNFFWYDAAGAFISKTTSWEAPSGAAYFRLRYRKTDSTTWTSSDLELFRKHHAIQPYWRGNTQNTDGTFGDDGACLDDGGDASKAQYPLGAHTFAHLETIVPNGGYIDRRNGVYACTSDGVTWTELPASDQEKLLSLRIFDGENNIYIPNGQHVKLMRQEMEDTRENGGSGIHAAFGNSITYGWTSLPETPRRTGWPYVEAIGKAVGLTTVNKGVNGQGLFAQGSTDPKTAYETLVENQDVLSAADLITLSWNKNDAAYALGTSADTAATETICGRWKKCLNYIRAKNKHAQIIILGPVKRGNKAWSETLGSGAWSCDDFETQLSAVAALYNIPFISWKKCSVVNNISEYAADNVHPNTAMYKQMAAYIAGQVSQYFRNVWEL